MNGVPWHMEMAEGFVLVATGLVKIVTFGRVSPDWEYEFLKAKVKLQCKFHKAEAAKCEIRRRT